MKKLPIILLAFAICLSLFAGCKPYIEKPAPTEPYIPSPEEIAYNEALNLISDGKLSDARLKLQECLDYKDAEQILARFVYKPAEETSKKEYWFVGAVEINDYRYEYEYDRHGNLILALGYADGTTLDAKYTYEYDEYGRMTRQDLYTPDDVIYKSYINEYDHYGNLVKGSIIDYNTSFNCFYKEFIYTYDEKGQILERIYKNPESGYIYEIESWTYDDQGNKLTYRATDGAGKETADNRYVYTYDEQGRITQVTTRNDLGSLVESYAYVYGVNGQIVQETHTDKSGSNVIEYNADHKVTEKRWYDTMGAMYIRDVNEYDENGNITQKIRYRTGGVVDYRYEYTYDRYGLVLTENKYDDEGNIEHRFEYEYAAITLYYNPFL